MQNRRSPFRQEGADGSGSVDADMAELVDAIDLGSIVADVQVRVLLSAWFGADGGGPVRRALSGAFGESLGIPFFLEWFLPGGETKERAEKI